MEEKKDAVLMEHLSNEKTQILSGQRYQYEFRREIVERGHAEKGLLDNEQRLELAFRGADAGIWDLDLHKDRCLVNQMWTDISGYPPKEMAHRVRLWRSRIHPDASQTCRPKRRRHLADC